MTTPHSTNIDPGQPEKKLPAKKKRNYKIIFGVLGGLLLLLLTWYFWSTRTVEESTKDGYVSKVAKVGTIMKTYEGQLNLAPTPIQYATSLSSDTWDFSLKDKELYDKLLQLQGKVVEVSYRQQGKSFPWQGKTKIFVYDVVEIEPSQMENYVPGDKDEDPAVPGERDTSAFY